MIVHQFEHTKHDSRARARLPSHWRAGATRLTGAAGGPYAVTVTGCH